MLDKTEYVIKELGRRKGQWSAIAWPAARLVMNFLPQAQAEQDRKGYRPALWAYGLVG